MVGGGLEAIHLVCGHEEVGVRLVEVHYYRFVVHEESSKYTSPAGAGSNTHASTPHTHLAEEVGRHADARGGHA